MILSRQKNAPNSQIDALFRKWRSQPFVSEHAAFCQVHRIDAFRGAAIISVGLARVSSGRWGEVRCGCYSGCYSGRYSGCEGMLGLELRVLLHKRKPLRMLGLSVLLHDPATFSTPAITKTM
jgi:hypothetical protein